MLARIILLAVLIWLVFALFRKHRRAAGESGHAPQTTQDMVRCEVCGIHQPKSESLLKNGRYYCCEVHSNASKP